MIRFHQLTAVALAATLASTPAASEAKDLKVGLLLPSSQVFAVYGEAVREGFNLALEEAGRQAAGRKIVVLDDDNKEDPKVTLQLARRFIKDDEVDFLVGPIASHVVAAIRDEVHRSKTFLLVANAGNNEVTGKGCSPYIVRTSFSNWQVNSALGQYAGESVGKSAMTIASNYDAGREMAAAFKEGLAKSGGKVAHEDWLAMGAADFAPTITNLRSRLGDVDMTWSFIVGAGGPRFVNQVTQAGIRGPKLKLVAPIWLGDELFFPAMGDNAIGMVIGGHYMSALNTPVNNAFQVRFQKRYGKVAHTMHVQGYDTAKLMIATVEAMKGDLRDKDKVRKALTSLKIDSPRGPFSIDARTGNVIQNIYIGEVVKKPDGALAHKVVKTYEKVTDPGTGCSL